MKRREQEGDVLNVLEDQKQHDMAKHMLDMHLSSQYMCALQKGSSLESIAVGDSSNTCCKYEDGREKRPQTMGSAVKNRGEFPTKNIKNDGLPVWVRGGWRRREYQSIRRSCRCSLSFFTMPEEHSVNGTIKQHGYTPDMVSYARVFNQPSQPAPLKGSLSPPLVCCFCTNFYFETTRDI